MADWFDGVTSFQSLGVFLTGAVVGGVTIRQVVSDQRETLKQQLALKVDQLQHAESAKGTVERALKNTEENFKAAVVRAERAESERDQLKAQTEKDAEKLKMPPKLFCPACGNGYRILRNREKQRTFDGQALTPLQMLDLVCTNQTCANEISLTQNEFNSLAMGGDRG